MVNGGRTENSKRKQFISLTWGSLLLPGPIAKTTVVVVVLLRNNRVLCRGFLFAFFAHLFVATTAVISRKSQFFCWRLNEKKCWIDSPTGEREPRSANHLEYFGIITEKNTSERWNYLTIFLQKSTYCTKYQNITYFCWMNFILLKANCMIQWIVNVKFKCYQRAISCCLNIVLLYWINPKTYMDYVCCETLEVKTSIQYNIIYNTLYSICIVVHVHCSIKSIDNNKKHRSFSIKCSNYKGESTKEGEVIIRTIQ